MSEWIVGFDGSRGAEAALAWTVATAHLSGDDIRVATVVDVGNPVPEADRASYEADHSSLAHARQMLDRAVTRHAREGVTITPEVIAGPEVAQTLIDVAVGSQALVVGSRGLGAFRRMLTGSVSREVADGALSNVVIVPELPTDESPRNAVVVGVDGSSGSQPAVHAGARMARLADAEMEVVTVQAPPDVTGSAVPARSAMDAYLWSGMPSSSVAALSAEVDRERTQVIDYWRSSGEQRIDRHLARLLPGERPDKVSRNVVRGRQPARELVAAAEWARLLVIGRSGHKGLPGLLLGSVSRHCVLHPPCPVMVVP